MKNSTGLLRELDSNLPKNTPRHLSPRQKGLFGKVLVAALVVSGVSTLQLAENAPEVAKANGSSEKVTLYLSAPMVQGSSVSDAVQRENFNAMDTPNCPSVFPAISGLTLKSSGAVIAGGSSPEAQSVCLVDSWTQATGPKSNLGSGTIYGGASTDTSTPTFGGTGSNYMRIPFYENATLANERSLTFELSSAAKYVGFWWSAGNSGNLVRFFDESDNLIAEIDSTVISTALSSSGGTVTSEGGVTYTNSRYFGNPVYYTDLTTKPADNTFPAYANDVIFTYLNLFVEGTLNVRKVQFAGPGFEFDNLAFSTVPQTPEDSMVKVEEKLSPGLSWAPATNLLLPASPSTPSQLATKSGDGAISYSVKNPGTTGCTVNSSTGVLTYSAVGECVVTATVTGTSTYLKSTKNVTFVISASSTGNSVSGDSSGPASPSTRVTAADPCTLKSTEVKGTKRKSFPGFAINSARVTPQMKRQIRNWLNKHPEEVCVSVRGFTMGPRVLPTDPKLARDRAKAVRAYIKSIRPEASFTRITSRTQRLVGDEVRRAKVTLSF